MKHKRQKQAHKAMVFFEKNFGITPPYNIMVDATFVKEALKNKVNIWDQLPRYLGGDVRLYTTSCALKELEAFGKLLYGPLKVMRDYKISACPHKEFGVDPVDCLRKTIKRSHPNYDPSKGKEEVEEKKAKDLKKFFIATQHRDLAVKVERTPGVPVLYLHGNAIILDRISDASLEAAGTLRQTSMVPVHERDLKALFEKEGLSLEEEGPTHRKKKLKGPNPLSVLKKRGGPMVLSRAEKIRERRKWRRVRKRKGGELSPLQELMMRELLVEDSLGWEGVIYQRKSIAELKEELANN
ncbi:rRNA-processing protein UTP23 homolog [Babylonia areolata]|uniref:rRNA-processing protein UTP23 homolog n=1 Tax=Babylonia areolata TaxID=304850 RepID=UPI003FD131EB